MSKPAIVVQHVSKWFVKNNGSRWPWKKNYRDKEIVHAVADVSFQVQTGEIFGVLGPNGSGKSTLIRLIATLLIPNEGSIEVFGRDVHQEELAVKELLNRVSVEASFFKKLTPMENLLYGARLYGLSGSVARKRIVSILTELGLRENAISQPMEQMSRGMQQKVAIARAFITEPKLLLMDEPTTGLDPRSKLEVQQVITRLREENGATILLTTHDMVEADILCDRIAILDEGKIVALGTPQELKQKISHTEELPPLEEVFLSLTGKHMTQGEIVNEDTLAALVR